MCRYAMLSYKPHYACFKCRKTFKRRLMWDINRDDKREVAAKCPQCRELMADMGLDFESPKITDVKAWEHIKTLYSVGITFHSCGCTGPGYIPATREKLIEYFEGILKDYNQNLAFWRQRTEPTTPGETDRENTKHWEYIRKVPKDKSNKNKPISNEDAKNYWMGKIREVEGMMGMLINNNPL